MIVLLLLFIVLVGWGLRDGELDWSDVAKYVGLMAVGTVIVWFIEPVLVIVPFVLVLILLVVRVLGGDVRIR
jgi:hypothetical protein